MKPGLNTSPSLTNLLRHGCAALWVLFFAAEASLAATISWSGAGGDELWSNPANWTGGTLPTGDDDVVINVPGNTTVRMDAYNVSVRSLQCAESFVLEYGPFRVTAGSSTISGIFVFVPNYYGLEATGAGTVLTLSGAVTNVVSLSALDGAVIAVPGARQLETSVPYPYASSLSASGVGSALVMTNLTNVVIAPYTRLSVSAASGSLVDLRRLQNPDGPLQVSAAAPDSMVNLSAMSGLWKLGEEYPLGWWRHALSATDRGTILIPNITAFENVDVAVAGMTNLVLNQIRSFTGGTLTLTSRTNGLNSLTNFSGSISATDTRLDLTNITAIHVFSNTSGGGISASQGSFIDLSRVTNVVEDSGYYIFGVGAYSGSRIDLRRMRVAQGRFSFGAEQAGSVVDLSGLNGEWTPQGTFYNNEVKATSGGSVLISNVTAMRNISLDLRDDAVVPTAQIRSFTDGTITRYRGTNSFAGLTNLDGSTVKADERGAVLIPNVTSMHKVTLDLTRDAIVPTDQVRSITEGYITLTSRTNGFARLTNFSGYFVVADTRLDLTNLTVLYATNSQMYFSAGQGSFIDLSRLTNVVTSPAGHAFTAIASGGSRIDLRRLRAPEGPAYATVEGLDSLIDLSDFNGLWLGGSISASLGGTILMPNVTALHAVNLDVRDTARVNLQQLTSFTAIPGNGFLRLYNRTNDLVGLTHFSGVLEAYDSRMELTNLTTIYALDPASVWFHADAGSFIDLSHVTNVVVGLSAEFRVKAYNGGRIDLSRLPVPENGPVAVDARSAGSFIDLSGFSGLWDGSGSVTALDGATVAISNVTAMRGISLNLRGDANLPTAQLTSYTEGGITVVSATNVFSALTNLSGTVSTYSVHAYDARLSFPSLTQLHGSNYNLFRAETDAVIDLSQVTNSLVGSDYFYLYAFGGRIELPGVESIAGSYIDVRADGPGSVVDLRGLSAFFSDNNSGHLIAQNGGVLILNTNALLLAGVAIDLQSNPGGVLPPFLAPSQSLVLYGQPWRSYRIESRDPLVAGSPWQLYLRVPLTTPFEGLGPGPSMDLALRVVVFVADPPEVDLRRAGEGLVQNILFGVPTLTYRLESATSLSAPIAWENGPTKTLTNSFFIYPGASATNSARFYRARKL